ncbi:MAG: cell division protein FtsL [Bacteroidia bacterium]|jgi:cell division protein FtsL
MATDKKSISTKDFTLTTEWIYYLGFLFTLALLYIYLTHRTDNIVREIESTKRDLVELRAENITLKSDIMKNGSRANLEARLSNRGVKEPNRAVKVIRIKND